MKKLLYLVVPMLLLLVSCRKDYPTQAIDESQWLRMERAIVVYSDNNCPFFVVETSYGYDVIRNQDGYIPGYGAVLYGNFSNYGTRTFYNRSERYLTSLAVEEYWISYEDAMDVAFYYCGR